MKPLLRILIVAIALFFIAVVPVRAEDATPAAPTISPRVWLPIVSGFVSLAESYVAGFDCAALERAPRPLQAIMRLWGVPEAHIPQAIDCDAFSAATPALDEVTLNFPDSEPGDACMFTGIVSPGMTWVRWYWEGRLSARTNVWECKGWMPRGCVVISMDTPPNDWRIEKAVFQANDPIINQALSACWAPD